MADQETQKRIAQEFIRNIGKGGVPAEHYAPDISAWSMLSGDIRGDVYLPRLAMVRQIFPTPLEVTIEAVTAQVGWVAVQARSSGTLFNGVGYSNDYMFMVEFDDQDRIRHVREYFEMTRVMDALVPAMQQWRAQSEAKQPV
jgi:ketosteroid isomerase-like protein